MWTCPNRRPPGHRGQHAERERHVDIAQVVFPRADHGELALIDRPANRRHVDALLARQIGTGDGVRVAQQIGIRPAVHDLTTVLAGRRPDVHHPVGVRDGVLVVFDDDQRVAEIP